MLVAIEIPKREVGRREGLVEPRPVGASIDAVAFRDNDAGSRRNAACAERRRSGGPERLGAERIAAFLDPNAMIHWKTREGLHEAVWPRDGHLDDALAFAQSEQQLLGVLGEEAGA